MICTACHTRNKSSGKGPSGNSKLRTVRFTDSRALAGVTGPVVLLTSTIVSPSTKQIITEFLAKYPGSRHVQYDAVSYSGIIGQ